MLNIRGLAPSEKMTVRRGRTNDVVFDVERNLDEIDEDAAELLASLVDGDFGSVNDVVIRRGKIVGIKTTKSNKVQDN